MILIYVPCKDKTEAVSLGKILLEEKLVACVNIVPEIISIYNWENKLEESTESILLLKTKFELYELINKRIKEIHSYIVPCVLKFEKISFNLEYEDWLKAQFD
jgi:periplasmic divalent cation tolerance protein